MTQVQGLLPPCEQEVAQDSGFFQLGLLRGNSLTVMLLPVYTGKASKNYPEKMISIQPKNNSAAASLLDLVQNTRNETQVWVCFLTDMVFTVCSPRWLPLKAVGHRCLPNILTCGTTTVSLVWNKSLWFSSMFLLFPLLQQCLGLPCSSFTLFYFCQQLSHECFLYQHLLNIYSSLSLNHLYPLSR